MFLAAGPGWAGPPNEAAGLSLSSEEQAILDLTNQARAKENLSPLKPNAVLFKVARAHAANMAAKGEMKHELDGKNPAQRVEAAGYDYGEVGENIAFSDGLEIAKVFAGWMDSPHHRENILKEPFQDIGIGVARNPKGEVYYTQVFGKQRKKS
ncbi:MAG: CAP domain-containing protein [Planctomycetes bacterium]|nr:CAP domain-containing protein [Planctomycetota bacterium]